MPEVKLNVKQVGEITSEATIRDHNVMIDRPEAKGGEDKGPMGGELLLAGLAGCFMSNLLAAIAARDIEASNMSIDVTGTLEDGPPRFTAVHMAVKGEFPDKQEMEKLSLMAERACISANTMKGGVDISISIG